MDSFESSLCAGRTKIGRGGACPSRTVNISLPCAARVLRHLLPTPCLLRLRKGDLQSRRVANANPSPTSWELPLHKGALGLPKIGRGGACSSRSVNISLPRTAKVLRHLLPTPCLLRLRKGDLQSRRVANANPSPTLWELPLHKGALGSPKIGRGGACSSRSVNISLPRTAR